MPPSPSPLATINLFSDAESVSVLLYLVILFWRPAEMVKEQDNK